MISSQPQRNVHTSIHCLGHLWKYISNYKEIPVIGLNPWAIIIIISIWTFFDNDKLVADGLFKKVQKNDDIFFD